MAAHANNITATSSYNIQTQAPPAARRQQHARSSGIQIMGYLKYTHGSSFVPPPGHNGGRSQTNLNSLNNGEFPFMNVLKMAGNWDSRLIDSVYGPDKLDANGYPTSLYSSGATALAKVPTQSQRPGNYICTWDGTGTIQFSGGGDILSGTASFTGSITGNVLTIPGTVTGTIQFGQRLNGGTTLPYTFIMNQLTSTTYTVSKSQAVASAAMTTDNGSKVSSGSLTGPVLQLPAGRRRSGSMLTVQFIIVTVGSPIITNIKVYHVDDAADIAAGKVFGKKFIQRLQEANFGVIRFLNWQNGNGSNVTTWNTRKPISYVFYSDHEMRSSILSVAGDTQRS